MDENNIVNSKSNIYNQEFSGKVILKYLLKYKWYIVIITFISAVISVIYALSLPNWYSATANAVPPKQSSSSLESMMSGFSSSLKELGLSKLTGNKGGDSYSFLVILESRVLLDSMIKKYNLKQLYFPKDDKVRESEVRNMFADNLKVEYLDEGNYNITILDMDSARVAQMVMDYINLANDLAQRVYQSETQFNTKYIEKRLNNIDSLLQEASKELANYSRQTGIISPQDQGKAFVEAISSIKTEAYKQEVMYEIMKNKYGENDQNTLNQLNLLNKIKAKMYETENKPGLVGNFSKRDAGEKGIQFLKRSAEFEALSKLKLFMMPMLEESKINVNRNISTLTIIDPPITPDKKSKPKRSLIVAGITLGAFLSSILIIIGIFAYKRFKLELKSI